MPTLSIDVSHEQQKQLTAMAAQSGQTINEYLLSCALVDASSSDAISSDAISSDAMTEEEAIQMLHDVLAPRLAEMEAGNLIAAGPEDVVREAKRRDAR